MIMEDLNTEINEETNSEENKKGQNYASEKEDCSSNLRATGTKPKLVISLGGAFNPVHTRHVMAMVEAKSWIEENTEYEVVAGRLAVAPDGYVKAKAKRSGYKCIRGDHRIKLCELACEEHSSWLSPYPKTIGSAQDCAKKAKSELEKTLKHDNIRIAIIIGADRAINASCVPKWRKTSEHINICIGRSGETDRIREMYLRDKEGNMTGSEFYLLPKELDNVSSTGVRLRLAEIGDQSSEENKRKVSRTLVDLGWICSSVAEYIVTNWTDLYMIC